MTVCIYVSFSLLISLWSSPLPFPLAMACKRWWKGGHGKGCGEGRAKANREKKKKIREQRGTLKSLA